MQLLLKRRISPRGRVGPMAERYPSPCPGFRPSAQVFKGLQLGLHSAATIADPGFSAWIAPAKVAMARPRACSCCSPFCSVSSSCSSTRSSRPGPNPGREHRRSMMARKLLAIAQAMPLQHPRPRVPEAFDLPAAQQFAAELLPQPALTALAGSPTETSLCKYHRIIAGS